jgi:hypothetical protein
MHWEHVQQALELLAIHFAPVEAFLKSKVKSRMNFCNEWLLACGTGQVRMPSLGQLALVPWGDMLNHSPQVNFKM